MEDNQKKILKMVAEGKISIDEAQKLLALTGDGGDVKQEEDGTNKEGKTPPRYMHVIVEPKEGTDYNGHGHKHKVNVRIPFGLIRAGIKMANLIPSNAAEHVDKAFKEKGMNFDIRHLKEGELEDMMSALQESEIYVDSDNEVVRLYAE